MTHIIAKQRLRNDLKKIYSDPPPGISASPVDSDIFCWNAIISGPENTPFEGGIFRLRLEFNKDYPNTAPRVSFYSKMFHPNVYKNGRVCLDILEEPEKWSSAFDVGSVLFGIQSMLGDPNPESPANSEANILFTTSPEMYEQIIRRDIVKSSNGKDVESDDEDENKNLKDALEQEELEDLLNSMAIQELSGE